MPNYLSTIPAPDANLAAADMTSNFHNFEAAMLNVVMNNQPGMMYWNGGDDDRYFPSTINWRNSTKSEIMLHTINEIRRANENGRDYLDMRDIFSNYPRCGKGTIMKGKLKFGETQMNIQFAFSFHRNMTLNLHGARLEREDDIPPINGVPNNGYWDSIEFYRPGNSINIPLLLIQTDQNFDLFYNYIY